MDQQSGLQPIVGKLATKYRKQLKLALFFSLSLFVLGIVFALTMEHLLLLVVGAVLSSLLLFLHAFQALDIDREGETNGALESFGFIAFALKLNYISLSISTIGIMYKLGGIVGSDIMMIIGGGTALISLVYLLFVKQKPNGYLIKQDLILMDLVYVISVVLLMFY